MTIKRFLFIFALLLDGGTVMAQNVNPPAGQYVFERGNGTLTVKPDGAFDLDTIGTNAHICELSGRITGGIAQLEGGACRVSFATRGDTVVIATNGADQCRDNCGARATFEGTYTRLSAACTNEAVKESRRRFKEQYDAKRYRTALETLSAVLATCENVLDWRTVGRIRNDVAVTQFNLGDKAGCLQTLQPLAKDAAMTDAEIKESFPPADAYDHIPIAKATRFNLELCRN